MSYYDGNFLRLAPKILPEEGAHQGRLPVRPNIDHLSFDDVKRRFRLVKDYLYSFDDWHWALFFIGLGLGAGIGGYVGYQISKWKGRFDPAKKIMEGIGKTFK